MPPPNLKAEVVSVLRLPVPENRICFFDPRPVPRCLAQAGPLVGQSVEQTVPSPQVPVHAGGGDLRSKLSDLGVRLHHATLRGDPAGAPARYVPQQVLQDLCLAFLAELSPCCGRGAVNGSSGDMQEGSPEGWRVYISFWGSTNTFDPCPPILLSLSYSQCSSCSQRPHLQPHHGWGQQQLLESRFWRC